MLNWKMEPSLCSVRVSAQQLERFPAQAFLALKTSHALSLHVDPTHLRSQKDAATSLKIFHNLGREAA